MKIILGLLALLSLVICLALPVMFFHGSITDDAYKNLLSAASISWFVFAIGYASRAKAN